MDRLFWLEKWKKNDIGFHELDFNSHLTTEGHRLRGLGPILVPLCGKSRDMLWLSNQGLEVIGVELAPQACESFFSENSIPLSREPFGEFERFRSDAVTLFAGDFLSFRMSELPKPIGGFYDRAALIAMPPEMRPSYAQKFVELANDLRREAPLRGLLITIQYDQALLSGPPFSISHDEVVRLYGDRFKIRTLHETLEKGSIRSVKLDLVERAYELTAT